MNKKLLIVGIVVVTLFGLGKFTATHSNLTASGISQPKRIADVKPKADATLPTCFKDNAGITISLGERQKIESALSSYLIDVPAGTNDDILISSFDGDKIAGSSRYRGNYGSYNFGATKDTNTNKYPSGWKITSYSACGV